MKTVAECLLKLDQKPIVDKKTVHIDNSYSKYMSIWRIPYVYKDKSVVFICAVIWDPYSLDLENEGYDSSDGFIYSEGDRKIFYSFEEHGYIIESKSGKSTFEYEKSGEYISDQNLWLTLMMVGCDTKEQIEKMNRLMDHYPYRLNIKNGSTITIRDSNEYEQYVEVFDVNANNVYCSFLNFNTLMPLVLSFLQSIGLNADLHLRDNSKIHYGRKDYSLSLLVTRLLVGKDSIYEKFGFKPIINIDKEDLDKIRNYQIDLKDWTFKTNRYDLKDQELGLQKAQNFDAKGTLSDIIKQYTIDGKYEPIVCDIMQKIMSVEDIRQIVRKIIACYSIMILKKEHYMINVPKIVGGKHSNKRNSKKQNSKKQNSKKQNSKKQNSKKRNSKKASSKLHYKNNSVV